MGEKQLFLYPTNVKGLKKKTAELAYVVCFFFLCGFRANLCPFNGSYWNWFALSINRFPYSLINLLEKTVYSTTHKTTLIRPMDHTGKT